MKKHIPELLSRIVIGSVFVESGLGKLRDLSKVVSYFESLHIPLAHLQAPMVSGLELLCGLFVLLGFFTRISSLPLIGIMLVALVTAKSEDISSFSDLFGMSEFLYVVVLVWLAVFGAQSISVDQWRCRRSVGACQVRTAE